MNQKQIVHISLGSDCAVKWNLNKYGFCCQTFPFDWCNTNHIKMIIDSLDNKFSNFFDYEIKDQSMNFDNLILNVKSGKRIITNNKIVFPHESELDYLDEEKYKKKYQRRIQRFVDVVQNKDIKKIFIRADNKKLNNNNEQCLIDSLHRFGVKNFVVKFISYDLYQVCELFDWKRSYINWNKIF